MMLEGSRSFASVASRVENGGFVPARSVANKKHDYLALIAGCRLDARCLPATRGDTMS